MGQTLQGDIQNTASTFINSREWDWLSFKCISCSSVWNSPLCWHLVNISLTHIILFFLHLCLQWTHRRSKRLSRSSASESIVCDCARNAHSASCELVHKCNASQRTTTPSISLWTSLKATTFYDHLGQSKPLRMVKTVRIWALLCCLIQSCTSQSVVSQKVLLQSMFGIACLKWGLVLVMHASSCPFGSPEAKVVHSLYCN